MTQILSKPLTQPGCFTLGEVILTGIERVDHIVGDHCNGPSDGLIDRFSIAARLNDGSPDPCATLQHESAGKLGSLVGLVSPGLEQVR